MNTASPATAENTPATTEGGPPQSSETQTNEGRAPSTPTEPQPIPTAEEAIESNNVDAIRALMRASSGALADPRPKTDWEGFDEPPDEEPAAPTAETSPPAPSETPAETPPEAPPTEPAAPPEAQPKKDPNRVRLGRFKDDDRKVIAYAAEHDGMSIDEAREALVASGEIQTPAAKSPKAEETPPSTPSAPSTTTDLDAQIADLETKMEAAGAAYDTVELSKLTRAHNRALAEKTKLELQQERAQETRAAESLTAYQSAEEQARQDATAMFPDAGVEGTALYEAIEDLIDSTPAEAFNDPDWPVTLAAKAARKIGYKPSAEVPKAPAKAVPKTLVPQKPARPVAPAGGATPPAAPAQEPSYEQEVADAGEDPVKIAALLRKYGTRKLEA